MSAATCVSDAELDQLLCNFLAGNPHARNELPRIYGARVRAQLKRRHPDLAARCLVEDAENRFWELLLRKSSGSFNPLRGRAWTYLGLILRTAVTDVYAENIGVGQTTRPKKQAGETKSELRLRLKRGWPQSLDHILDQAGETEGNSLYDRVADPMDEYAAIDDADEVAWRRCEAERIVALARKTEPTKIAPALEKIREGASLTEAAAACGAAWCTMRRRLDRWVNKQHVIVAA